MRQLPGMRFGLTLSRCPIDNPVVVAKCGRGMLYGPVDTRVILLKLQMNADPRK